MFDFTVIAFVSGIAIGSIATARISAWWHGRKVQKMTRLASKIAAL
jgi:hypothetical protein